MWRSDKIRLKWADKGAHGHSDGIVMNEMGNGQYAMKRRQRGFTLVELLVGLVILGLLAAIAAPQVAKYMSGARADTAAINVDRLAGILDLYMLDVGRYPSTEEGLIALLEKPQGSERWNGPYAKPSTTLDDPWGNAYQYRSPGEHGEYDLFSFGSDGQEGGEGNAQDLTNW